MSNTKIIISIIVVTILLFLAVTFLPRNQTNPSLDTPETQSKVEAYVRENISTLSPKKEELGGKFYVTKIEFLGDGRGRVEYEDGHIALVANFKYNIDKDGNIEIDDFDSSDKPNVFDSKDLGLRFEYPADYFISRHDSIVSGKPVTRLVLMEDTEENRQLSTPGTPPREGPVSMTISIYASSTNQSADNWVRNMPESNFNLSPDKALSTKSVGGQTAVSYKASGLYENDNVVVATNKFVYHFVGFYMSPEDKIRQNFESLLKSVSFQ